MGQHLSPAVFLHLLSHQPVILTLTAELGNVAPTGDIADQGLTFATASAILTVSVPHMPRAAQSLDTADPHLNTVTIHLLLATGLHLLSHQPATQILTVVSVSAAQTGDTAEWGLTFVISANQTMIAHLTNPAVLDGDIVDQDQTTVRPQQRLPKMKLW